MPFPHEVYKVQRVVPLRFHRGVTGQPNGNFPDIDDRGFFRASPLGNDAAKNDHGPVVGVAVGDTVFVKISREKVDDTALLFVTSSDKTVMTVGQMGTGLEPLTNTHDMFIQVTGVAGSGGIPPKIARAQIRFGSNTGPIIGELSVWVFTKVNVNLTPHNVTIQDASATGGIASTANVTQIMDMVKEIWKPCGVTFTVSAVQNDTVSGFANAGQATWKTEINTLLATNSVPGTINAYFISELAGNVAGFLGFGFSRATVVADAADPNPFPNPGIILADQTAGINRSTDTHFLANDLAHEVGHFFTLAHVDRRNGDNPRNDPWALRMLMHPINTHRVTPAHHNDTGYGTEANGNGYRGALITMKDLVDSGNAAHHSTDGESAIARTTINSVAGPY